MLETISKWKVFLGHSVDDLLQMLTRVNVTKCYRALIV